MAGGMNKRGGHGYGTMAERIAATKAAAAPPPSQAPAAAARRAASARAGRPPALLGRPPARPGAGAAHRVAAYGVGLAGPGRAPGPRPDDRRLDPGRGVAAGRSARSAWLRQVMLRGSTSKRGESSRRRSQLQGPAARSAYQPAGGAQAVALRQVQGDVRPPRGRRWTAGRCRGA